MADAADGGSAPLAAAAIALAATAAVLLALRACRAKIYDTLIVDLTEGWYAAVLARLPERARLLDVGIGTGSALLRPANQEAVKAKRIAVTGVDIDGDYVKAARAAVEKAGLQPEERPAGARGGPHGPCVDVRHRSVYDVTRDEDNGGDAWDAAYFSASLMLVPDPVQALVHVRGLLSPGGTIYVTQTFEGEDAAAASFASRLVTAVKPYLKYFVTIDFGTATFRRDFDATVKAAKLRVADEQHLGQRGGAHRTFKLLVLEDDK
uniref:Methyltransferase domain-containing protein n=1 Tax=Bicosoecida sp. CB-2014 TaxID=1486930 RepID=A0A7S1CNE2_9STRA|mmetsp:Transcript_53/g.188  ORF Transcript_53/g.188 Transcript_53/m.188 type:complete len:264 (+) Transcript_53:128-919(+)